MQRSCAVLCYLWPDWPYRIFPHYSINGTLFGKKCLKRAVLFSLRFLSKIFLILVRTERDIIINVHTSSCIVTVKVLMKKEFSRHIPENCSNKKFHENHSSGSQIFRCGRTDRHGKANSGYSYNKPTRCTNFPNLFLE